ncbi:MAG: DNA helicase RecQ [Clostridia bacterium]|nr:DNA helicase RecQ [Clostridia bacterium]
MDPYTALRRYFGYTSFREGQKELIDAILTGKDAMGVMPTGGGKSLCYQIPVLTLGGMTVVISPLISLMKDQVMALKEANVPAAFLNSSLSFEQTLKVYDYLRQGRYRILYVAPERLDSEEFLSLCRSLPITLLAVDEAHCISEWGNDFRPSYLKIADFVASLPKRPRVAAFTATATERVRGDIITKLSLHDPYCVVTGFDRPNLYFDVRYRRSRQNELLSLIRERKKESGIVYCMTRANVEKITDFLCENGINATRYHAGLSDEERRRNQEDFVYDRKTVMVSTNAFGMGIDKSNVSFVIHYNMPLSLEAYYQEAGRAGRDGAPADCILLYGEADIHMAKLLIDRKGDEEEGDPEELEKQRRFDYARLDKMISYAKTTKCLRGVILDYFGQSHADTCGNCSCCKTTFFEKDITVEAQKILSCVKRIRDRLGYSLGLSMTAQVLAGGEGQRLLSLGLHEIKTYGAMKELSQREIMRLITYLCDRGYLEKNESFQNFSLLPAAEGVLFGGEKVIMLYRKEREKTQKEKKSKNALSLSEFHEAKTENPSLDEKERSLYQKLVSLRTEIASTEHVPAYIVFSNATLIDMAKKRPTDSEAFLEISGVGRIKAMRYGEQFLSLIRKELTDGSH